MCIFMDQHIKVHDIQFYYYSYDSGDIYVTQYCKE